MNIFLNILTQKLITLLVATLFINLNLNAQCNNPERYQTGTFNGKPYAFMDSNGEPYFMNGVNVRNAITYSGSPRYSQTEFNQIAEKGFNSVRLTLDWRNFERSNGGFHQASLNGLDALINRAEQAGLSVILDPLHIKGDVYWTIPDWAWGNVNPANLTRAQSGKLVWGIVETHGISYLREFVSRYCNNPTVIAIDLVNELREPELNISLNGDGNDNGFNEMLIDLYADWIDDLRTIDNNKIFLLEPFYGIAKITETRLAPLASYNNIVWSFHDYFVGEGSDSDGFSNGGYATGRRCESWEGSGQYPLNSRTKARADMTNHINVHLTAAHSVGIPVHIGEYGIPDKDGSAGWTGKSQFMCDKRTVYTSLDIPFTAWVWNKDIDNGFGLCYPASNSWLAHSDALVNSNCGSFSNPDPDPDPDPNPTQCNLIKNANFNAGQQHWETYVSSTANASLTTNAGYADLTISNGSSSTYKVQLFQSGFRLQQGKTYEVSFKAKADAVKSIYVKMSNSADNIEYNFVKIDVENTWSTKNIVFSMNNATDANVRMSFGVGKNATDIAIDDVVVKEQNCVACTPGATCNDNDPCTINDVYDADCNCSGTYKDADGDGVCIGEDTNDNNASVPNACCELIENGTFNNSSRWDFYSNAQANASFNTNGQKANINITNGGTENWHVQIYQRNISIVSGKRYLISFKAKASSNRNITIDVGDAIDNSSNYYEELVELNTQFSTSYFIFEPNESNANVRLVFSFGKNASNVEIDDVVFKEISCSNLDNLITNSHFDGGINNWIPYVNGAASASQEAVNDYINYTINNGGTSNWHVQLMQKSIALSPGVYTLSYKAKASSNRSIHAELGKASSPYTTYSSNIQNINAQWNTYNARFNVTTTSNNARLVFNLGKNNADVFFDDIILVKETNADLKLNNIDDAVMNELKAYPNPFADKISIDMSNNELAKGMLTLYNAAGKLVYKQSFENQEIFEINTTDLLAGMYIIQIKSEERIYSKKLLK